MRRPSKNALAKLGLRAAGVAHDMAQPLSIALLAAQQTKGKGVSQLKAALSRMEKLLQTLREELRSPSETRASIPLKLAQLGQEVLAGLKPAEKKRVHMKLKGDVNTDAHALHRILENLVLNALRHGEGVVRVTSVRQANQLTFLVNGGARKTARTTGWGVGLASSRDLAKKLGYTLSVEVSPQGSQVRLTPIAKNT